MKQVSKTINILTNKMFGNVKDLVWGSNWQNQCFWLWVCLSFSPSFVRLTGPRMHPLPAVFQAAPVRRGGQAADRQREILHPSERRQVHCVPQPHKYGSTSPTPPQKNDDNCTNKYQKIAFIQSPPPRWWTGSTNPIVLSLSTSCGSASMLKVNPDERLSITELVNQLQEIAAARNVNPKSPVTEVKGHFGLFIHAFINDLQTVTVPESPRKKLQLQLFWGGLLANYEQADWKLPFVP